MLLARCGIDPSPYFSDEDFRGVVDFNTTETLNTLGVATSDIGQMCLSEIARTVRAQERQPQNQNRTFAQQQQSEYTKAEKENERSVHNDTSSIHNRERDETPESHSSSEQRDTFWSVRRNAQTVSQGQSQTVLHESQDTMQTGQSSERNSDESDRDGKPPDETDGETRGLDRDSESTKHDGLGSRDEQPQESSAGNRIDGSSLSEVSDELPPLVDEELILGILANKDDDLVQNKEAIVAFFKTNTESERRVEFLKSVYPVRYTELDINNQRVGYSPTENGLLMWEGNYPTRTKESVFSWSLVAELTDSLIKQGKYIENQSPQINLFDFADSIPMEQNFDEPEQTSLLFDFTLPQQIIDEALCIGSNEPNSKLDIVMFFRRDRGNEYNAKFLKTHYGTNGAGFYFQGEPIAVWYNQDGMYISRGKSAQKSTATHLSWEQVANRIGELLDMGRYLPQYQLDKVDNRELTFLAERITTSLIEPLKERYGYPDELEVVKNLLSNPDTFEDLDNDYIEFMDNRRRGSLQSALKYSFRYSPEYIYEIMKGMSLVKKDYIAESGYNPERDYFISDDEIDKLLLSGTMVSGGKERVVEFFKENPDLQKRAQMLKNEYGLSGFGSGNDNANFDGKGFYFSHGSIMKPYAKVLLPWTDIAKRVDRLIKAGKYISAKEVKKAREEKPENQDNTTEKLTDEQIKELNTLDDLFRACKIDDITVSFDGKTLIAKDEENVWKDAEVYDFILNEVLAFEVDGLLVKGLSMDSQLVAEVAKNAAKYKVKPIISTDVPDFIKNYAELQVQYPNTILFMKVGEFYEVLGKNANDVAKELDLVLTSRTSTPASERIPMVGVPAHNIDFYLSQLVAKGYTVALAEQEDVTRLVAPGKTKSIMKETEESSLASRLVQFAKDYDFYEPDRKTFCTGILHECIRSFAKIMEHECGVDVK